MARVLLLIVLVWLLYVVIKRIFAAHAVDNGQNSEKPAEKAPEKIVQCAKCGLHVPESESHINSKLVICNNAECNTLTKHDQSHNGH